MHWAILESNILYANLICRRVTAHVIKVYGPESGDLYDLTIGSVSLNAFTISEDGFETVSGSCDSSTTQTKYHNGSSTNPVIGNIIYDDINGLNVFNGDSLFYKVGTDSFSINENGEVISIESCVCSETSAPVVDDTEITMQENEDFRYSIQATNNPNSFSVSGDCREYEFFGGLKGAVFSGTDCTTGLTKQFSVSSNQVVSRCFFIGTAQKVGGSADASFSDLSGCLQKSLPEGLSFILETGTIFGTPTQSGDFQLTINATNCFGTGSDETINITVKPEREPNVEFQVDTSNPQTSSSNACAISSPSYSALYHNGILEYPVIYDMIFSDPEGLNLYNGNNQWLLTESGVAILIDDDGIVTDTFLCGINTPTPPSYASVSLAYGSDASAACSNTTFNTYYYDGTLGVNPGNLYSDSAGTTLATAGNYKYDTGGGFIQFPWDGSSWGTPADCPL